MYQLLEVSKFEFSNEEIGGHDEDRSSIVALVYKISAALRRFLPDQEARLEIMYCSIAISGARVRHWQEWY